MVEEFHRDYFPKSRRQFFSFNLKKLMNKNFATQRSGVTEPHTRSYVM